MSELEREVVHLRDENQQMRSLLEQISGYFIALPTDQHPGYWEMLSDSVMEVLHPAKTMTANETTSLFRASDDRA